MSARTRGTDWGEHVQLHQLQPLAMHSVQFLRVPQVGDGQSDAVIVHVPDPLFWVHACSPVHQRHAPVVSPVQDAHAVLTSGTAYSAAGRPAQHDPERPGVVSARASAWGRSRSRPMGWTYR